MDKLNTYRDYIEKILEKHASYKASHKNSKAQLIFDRKHDNYQFNSIGWKGHARIFGCLVNISLINKKIYIQYNGTENLVDEFTDLGVPKKDIVLAFHPKSLRKYTDFAIE